MYNVTSIAPIPFSLEEEHFCTQSIYAGSSRNGLLPVQALRDITEGFSFAACWVKSLVPPIKISNIEQLISATYC